MGTIIDINPSNEEKKRYTFLLEKEEFLLLEGNHSEIHLFAEENFSQKAGITETGIKHSTKYFTVPSEIMLKKYQQKRKNGFRRDISCQYYHFKDKEFYIYTITLHPVVNS